MWVFSSLKNVLLGFVIVVLLVAILVWLYLNIAASMHVSAQDAQIRLSHSLATKIQVGEHLQVSPIGRVGAELMIDRDFVIPLQGRYLTGLKFDTVVPITIDVDYETVIHIDEVLPLVASTDLIFPNQHLPKFPISLDIPIKLDVPFHLKRTYRLPVRIMFNDEVDFSLNEEVKIHVLHQFAPELNLKDGITVRKIADFDAMMYNSERNSAASLSMYMNLPLRNIHP